MKPQKRQGWGSLGGLGSRCSRQAQGVPLGEAAPAPPWSRTQSPGVTSVWSAMPVSCAHPMPGTPRPSLTMTRPSEGGEEPQCRVGVLFEEGALHHESVRFHMLNEETRSGAPLQRGTRGRASFKL